MYPYSDSRRLSPDQMVSLDKHQQMINSALKWQEYDQLAKASQDPRSIASLRNVFAILLNLFSK